MYVVSILCHVDENVDEEYMEEQQKVKELSNDELKKYPYSVLKVRLNMWMHW